MSVTAPASKTPTTTYQYGMNTAQPRQGDFGGWLTGPSRPAFPQGENTYKQTNPAGGNYGEWLTGPTPTAAGGKPMDMSMYSPGKAQPTQTQSQGSPYQPPGRNIAGRLGGTTNDNPGTAQYWQGRGFDVVNAGTFGQPSYGGYTPGFGPSGEVLPGSFPRDTPMPQTPSPRLDNRGQPMSPNQYYNDKGQVFGGTQSYAIGTSPQAMAEGRRRHAESQGFFRPDDPRLSPGVRIATPESQAASREYAAWRQSGYAGYTPAQPPLSMDELSRLSPEQRGRLADTERSGMEQAFNRWRQGNAGSPNRNDQYAPPRREPAILIDGRSQRGPAPDQQQNPFAGMQPGVYSPTGQFYDGNLAQGLSQAQRQRDAFVMQMNQATLPYQMANVFGADLGAPSYDFQGMLGRANKMVEDGFHNPFTQYFDQDLADQMSRYAPPSMYQSDRGPRGGIYT